MKYPWTSMPHFVVKTLINTPVPDLLAYATKVAAHYGWDTVSTNAPYALSAGMVTLCTVGRWLKSDRMIIEITPDSCELLESWEPRFDELPLVHAEPWKRSFVFRLDDTTLVYAEPLAGDVPGVTYTVWIVKPDGEWATVTGSAGDNVMLEWSKTDWLLQDKGLAPTLLEWEGVTFELDRFRILNIVINAMAALEADARILSMGSRKAPRKNRKVKSGAVTKMRRFTLTKDGAAMVTRRWEIIHPPPASEKIEHKPHASPGLHTVEPHPMKVWVNNPKPMERVLKTRKRTRVRNGKTITYNQYLVKRWRGRKDGKPGSYSRGGKLQAKRSAIATGPDDLTV